MAGLLRFLWFPLCDSPAEAGVAMAGFRGWVERFALGLPADKVSPRGLELVVEEEGSKEAALGGEVAKSFIVSSDNTESPALIAQAPAGRLPSRS